MPFAISMDLVTAARQSNKRHTGTLTSHRNGQHEFRISIKITPRIHESMKTEVCAATQSFTLNGSASKRTRANNAYK